MVLESFLSFTLQQSHCIVIAQFCCSWFLWKWNISLSVTLDTIVMCEYLICGPSFVSCPLTAPEKPAEWSFLSLLVIIEKQNYTDTDKYAVWSCLAVTKYSKTGVKWAFNFTQDSLHCSICNINETSCMRNKHVLWKIMRCCWKPGSKLEPPPPRVKCVFLAPRLWRRVPFFSWLSVPTLNLSVAPACGSRIHDTVTSL